MQAQILFLKNLMYATVCVALVLLVLLVSVFLIDLIIAPMLVDASKKLAQVNWEQIMNLCYLSSYILVTCIAILLAIKVLWKK